MNVLKIAAFSDGETGGNPAGVVIADVLPPAAQEIGMLSRLHTDISSAPGSSIRVSGTARIMQA